jgi:DNA (cytosine-5)-methyltransferase 1
VERHAGPTHAILLENVPGLLSSNAGRDFGALLAALGDLGYGWAYRVLDASLFGVPQRRRRVFICAIRRGGHPDPDGAAEVLAVGSRCERDHAQERAAWAVASRGAGARADRTGIDIAGAITRRYGKGVNTTIDDGAIVVESPGWATQQRVSDPSRREHSAGWIVGDRPGPSPDPDGVRAADGLAGRLDGGPRLEAWTKAKRAASEHDDESWTAGDVTPTLNGFDVGDARAVTLVQGAEASYHQRDRVYGVLAPSLDAHAHSASDSPMVAGAGLSEGPDDPMLPLGLDSHRYRCCGNGVVAPVAEWIGHRLAAWAKEQQ